MQSLKRKRVGKPTPTKTNVYLPGGELVRPRKNSLRLKNYDYHLPGPYFITVCTNRRINLFERSSVRNHVIEIIKTVGADLSARIHCIVTAVDHIHGLFSLPEDKKDSLSKFVAIMKVRITQLLREGRINPSLRVWQRGFYDHVIRDEKDFLEKAQYIENHPIKEESDTYTEWH